MFVLFSFLRALDIGVPGTSERLGFQVYGLGCRMQRVGFGVQLDLQNKDKCWPQASKAGPCCHCSAYFGSPDA